MQGQGVHVPIIHSGIDMYDTCLSTFQGIIIWLLSASGMSRKDTVWLAIYEPSKTTELYFFLTKCQEIDIDGTVAVSVILLEHPLPPSTYLFQIYPAEK